MPYRTPPSSVEIARDQLDVLAQAIVVKSAAGDHVTVRAKWKSSFFTLTNFYIALAVVALAMTAACKHKPIPLIALAALLTSVAAVYDFLARPARTITFFSDVRAATMVSGPLAQTIPVTPDDISVSAGWRPQISVSLGGWRVLLHRRSESPEKVANAAHVLRQIVGVHRMHDEEVQLNGVPAVSRLSASAIHSLGSKLPHRDVAVEPERISFWAPAPFLPLFLGLMLSFLGVASWWLASIVYDVSPDIQPITVVAGIVAVVLFVPGVILSFRKDPWLGKNLIVIPRGRSEVLLLEGVSGNWRETGEAREVRRFPVEVGSFRFVENEGAAGVTIHFGIFKRHIANGADAERCGSILAQYATTGEIDGA